MEFTQPPEMTTALTDLLLGVFVLSLVWRLRRYLRHDEIGVGIWRRFFTLLGLAALAGVPAHGLKCISEPGPIQYAYWMPFSLLLGAMISAFLRGVIFHWKGPAFVRAAKLVVWPLCGLFFATMLILSRFMEEYFVVFVVFETVCMLFVLVVYCSLAISRRSLSDGMMVVGVALTILGAILQAQRSISFTVIWVFDYNSVYHFVQLAATCFLYLGIVWRMEKTDDVNQAA